MIYLKTFKRDNSRATYVTYSSKGDKILFAFSDGIIIELDICTGNILVSLNAHKLRVNGVLYSSDEKRVLSASSDNTIKEWDLKTGECLKTFKGHTNGVEIAFYINEAPKWTK